MAQVTAQMIKELRERTGVGMSKCKAALEESNGDMELAISNLRKAGMATAVKKEGRTTNEGQITVKESDDTLVIVEINAETDFVVGNDRFQEFLNNIAEEANKTKPESIEAFLKQPYSKDESLTIDEYRGTIVQTIGENIQIRRLKTFAKNSNHTFGVYSHMGGKIVVVVEVTGSGDEGAFARDVAMHIAAASPEYLSPEKVPAEVVDYEKEIAKSQMKGKPENIMDKIITGKMNSFYDEHCLLRQKYIKDDSLSISDLVNKRSKESGKELVISDFTRWSIGR